MNRGRLLRTLVLAGVVATTIALPVAEPADATLVAAYAFEETGGPGAADSSGRGNTGTIAGASSTAAGKFGRGLAFDGSNDLVSIADSPSLDLTTGMTLEAWVNPQSGDWRTVLLKERPGGLAYALYASTDTNRPSAEIRTSSSSEARGTASLPADTWAHLAATYDGAALRLYVNGVQASSRALTGSIEVGSGTLRIGGNTVWGEYFRGTLDEVRVYNRALTAAEIAADMATPIAPSDVDAPSAPGNLTATVAQDDVQLSWSASVDDTGVTAYRIHRSGTAGFTPDAGTLVSTLGGGATAHTDANRPLGTSYYRVVAVDAAGNASVPSGEATATISDPDAEPPTAPTNLAASVSGDVVHLTWGPSSDDLGVAGYRVYRSTTPGFFVYTGTFVSVGAGTTSYDDDVNEPGGTFFYKVIAVDAFGHHSLPSNEAAAILDADTTAPTVAIDAPCDGSVAQSEYFYVFTNVWDDRGTVNLRLVVDGTTISELTVGSTRVRVEWSTRNSWSNGTHVMTAIARDAAGNETTSEPCTWLIHNKVLTVPIVAPADGVTVRGIVTLQAEPRGDGEPLDVTGVAFTATGLADGWASGSEGYATSWDTRALPNGVYLIQAQLYHLDYGNPQATNTIEVTVDNSVPEPTGLAAAVTEDDVQLSWDAAPTGVTGFRLHRSLTAGFTPGPGSLFAALNGSVTSHLDANRPAGTWYYRLVAVDADGNASAPSGEIAATVAPDLQPPSAPGNLTASVTTDDVRLSWSAADDNRGVTSYRVHRSASPGFTPGAGTLVATLGGSATSHQDADRPVGIWYYRVVAVDAAGNTGVPTAETSAAVAAPPVPTGLVAAFAFEELSGAAALDRSGSGNTGTLVGATRHASGRYGRAVSFDGVNDLVTVADAASLDLTTGMTLEAWVFPTASTNWRTVLLKERPGGLAYALYSATETGRPGAFADTGTEYDARGPASLPLSTWTHVAGTYDGSTLRFYVNGALVSSRAVSGSLRVSSGALQIGGNTVWSEWFAGRIDEVRVYNRALSAAEIAVDRDTPLGAP